MIQTYSYSFKPKFSVLNPKLHDPIKERISSRNKNKECSAYPNNSLRSICINYYA